MKKAIPPALRRHLQNQGRSILGGTGLTWKSILVGLVMVLLVSLGAPYSIWLAGSSEITWSYFPIGVGAPFFALLLLNTLIKLAKPAWALAAAELITAVVMGLVASGIPIFLMGYVLSIISKPYYGATPINQWATHIHSHLPTWAIPAPTDGAMDLFYQGLPLGAEKIPYGVWIGPLLWWMSLLLALYLVCFCLVVILRRQWVERERLAFPLAEVPLMLVEENPDSALPPIFRSRVFWIGCFIPLSIILFNTISYFEPGAPQIRVHQETPLKIFAHAPALPLLIYFPVVGFTYLVSTAISFSVWFFFLFTLLETNVVNWSGLALPQGDTSLWGTYSLSWQAYGAFCAMVAWSLWIGRRHLLAVARKVFAGASDPDDSTELLSYRTAVWGLIAGYLYTLGWLWASGLALHLALLYLTGALTIFLGITRLVIQAGFHYLTTPMSSQALTLAITGTALPPANLVALGLTYAWCGDIQSIFMVSAAHAAKLNELCRYKRHLGAAILLAVVVGFIASTYFILELCYEYGAVNFRSWFFQSGGGAGDRTFDGIVRQLKDPQPPDGERLSLFGLGAVLYWLMAILHYRVHWWPLHPLGLTIATVWMVRRIVFSIFIAWLAKTLILRFGGIQLYRQLRPFFIGLPVGFFAGVGIAYLLDVLYFFGKGHPILHG